MATRDAAAGDNARTRSLAERYMGSSMKFLFGFVAFLVFDLVLHFFGTCKILSGYHMQQRHELVRAFWAVVGGCELAGIDVHVEHFARCDLIQQCPELL